VIGGEASSVEGMVEGMVENNERCPDACAQAAGGTAKVSTMASAGPSRAAAVAEKSCMAMLVFSRNHGDFKPKCRFVTLRGLC